MEEEDEGQRSRQQLVRRESSLYVTRPLSLWWKLGEEGVNSMRVKCSRGSALSGVEGFDAAFAAARALGGTCMVQLL